MLSSCAVCGKSGTVDLHHIEPRRMGGSKSPAINAEGNLLPLCRVCHSTIHVGMWKLTITENDVRITVSATGEQVIHRPRSSSYDSSRIFQFFNLSESTLEEILSLVPQLDDDHLVTLYSYAASFGKRAWILQAAVLFEAQERSVYGDQSLEAVARCFEVGLRHAQKYSLVWRLFFKDETQNVKIDVFSLEEASWYVIAATETDKPHTWLAYAQDRKAQNPQYGVSAFRRDIQMSRWMQGVGDVKDPAGQDELGITAPSWRCPWVELRCLQSGKPVPRSECQDCDFAKEENCETKPTYLEGDDDG